MTMRKRFLLATSVLLLTALGIGFWTWVHTPCFVEVLPGFDVTDDRKLADFADNIFVGEVVARTGQVMDKRIPETQFSVQVLENIKGSLPDLVTVNQEGGRVWGQPVLIEGDSLVERGKTYLFVTRHSAVEEWYTLVSVYGRLEISNDSERLQLVERFRVATEEQIPFR